MHANLSDLASSATTFPVTLLRCTSYERKEVQELMGKLLCRAGILAQDADEKSVVSAVFDADSNTSPSVTSNLDVHKAKQNAVFPLRRGMQVLVKPNLLRGNELTCTHAEVVRAVCLCLQEAGIRVRIFDSPGFGTAAGVAEKIGLTAALAPLGLKVQEFSKPNNLILPNNLGTWPIGQEAFEADALISVPRLKVHSQMRLTLGVKNLFGCICGLRKALAHTVQGRTLEDFCRCILALYAALPPTAAVLDGVVGMHKRGPTGGEAFPAHILGASPHAQALDTAIYTVLGVLSQYIPLWHEAQKELMHAAFAENIHYTDMLPSQCAVKDFVFPAELKDISFQPHRLLLSYMRRMWRRYF